MSLSNDELTSLITAQALNQGVNPDLALAVATHESSLDPAAQNGHAQGLFQLMPAAAQDMGVHDRMDPEQNIRGGVGYLRSMVDRYNGNTDLALAAYNQGPGNVDQYGVTPEGQKYIDAVKRVAGKREVPAYDTSNLQPVPEGTYFDFGTPAAVPPAPKDATLGENIADIGKGLVSGGASAVKMAGETAEALSPEGSYVNELGHQLADKFGQYEKDWAPQQRKRGLVADALVGAAPIVGMAAPAILAGLVDAPATLVAGGMGLLFGGSSYTEKHEQITAAGGSADDARNAGLLAAGINSVGLTAITMLTGGLGRVASSVFKGTEPSIAGVMDTVSNPEIMKPFFKAVGVRLAADPAIFAAQSVANRAVDQNYDLPTGTLSDTLKQAVKDGVGMALLASPVAGIGAYRSAQSRTALGKALADPDADPKDRIQAVMTTGMVAKSAGVPISDIHSWLDGAAHAIDTKAPITPDLKAPPAPPEFVGPPAPLPVVHPDVMVAHAQTELDALNQKASQGVELTDAEKGERQFLQDNINDPEALANAFNHRLETPEETQARVQFQQDAATGEWSDFYRQEQTDAAYRQRAALQEGRKNNQLDAVRVAALADQAETAPAVTRAHGFDDRLPTAMELALLRAKQSAADRERQNSQNLGAVPKQPDIPDVSAIETAPNLDEAIAAASKVAQSPVAHISEVTTAPIPSQPAIVIQNRDRSQPESIMQMRGIAANPDASRLSFSRDAANGAPVIVGALPDSARLGKTDHVVTSSGRKLAVQYAVVDANDIAASHDINGQPNAEYETGAKPRAIGGNGRVAGIQEAYRTGSADNYRKGIADDAALHGVSPSDIAKIKDPVLVRVMRQEDITPNIGDELNGRTNMGLSAVEQAKTDARRVKLETLDFKENGDISDEAVRAFVLGMPENERNELMDGGQPGRKAVERMTAAIFYQAYGDDELVRLFSQAQDIESKAVMSALANAAPSMAMLVDAKNLDIRSAVADSAKVAINAARKGISLLKLSAQGDITLSKEVVAIVRFMADNIRRPKIIGERLTEAAQFAYGIATEKSGDMFGAPTVIRDDIIRRIANDNESRKTALEQQRGGGPDESNVGAKANEPAGHADRASAEESAGPGFRLEQHSNQDIDARQRVIAEQDAAVAVERAAEAREKAAKDQAELESRTKARVENPDNFQFGESSKAAAEPTGDLFGAQTAAAHNLRAHPIPKEAETPVSTFSNSDELKALPDYRKAKAGDIESASQLVEQVVTQQNLDEAKRRFGEDAIYAAPMATESLGHNAIPHALAAYYAHQTGAKLSGSIEQLNRAGHTGADPMERLKSKPIFGGDVVVGGKYVLVDDVTTLGGTLAEMANYIQSRGGKVAGVVTLANAGRDAKLSAPKHVTSEIERRYGDEIRKQFGIEPKALTANEAGYLIGFRNVDELRTRAAKALQGNPHDIPEKEIPAPESDLNAKTPTTAGVSTSEQQNHPDRSSPLASRHEILDPAIDALTDEQAIAVGKELGLNYKRGKDIREKIKQEHPDDQERALGVLKRGSGVVAKDETRDNRSGIVGDFGQKIAGARKDYATEYADKMKDAVDADVAKVPLSQSWPEPNYQKMLADGVDPWVIAFIHAARDEIPTKPSRSYKLGRWVAQVQMLRDLANRLISDPENVAKAKKMLASEDFATVNKIVGGRADLYLAAGHDRSLKGVTLSEGRYSLYDGVKYDPPKVIWSVSRPAKASAFSNWPKQLATGDTREAAIKNFADKAKQSPGLETKEKEVSFNLYRSNGGFFIGKKVGKGVMNLLDVPDVKEGRRIISEENSRLVDLLEKKKATPYERNEFNAPRVGEDHRNGEDVTPEQFQDAFGFRGGQFGNTILKAKGEAQDKLNATYDALHDLAGVLDIPPKALSLNGELALAFGARGHGGTNAPSAHYEPDSTGKVGEGTVVINLTRKNGAGSLAHEWWHGVDNYFARMRGEKGGFVTDNPATDRPGLRQEMKDAFVNLMQNIKDTDLRNRSRILDTRRSKPYWSTPLEMSARSFESYIIAKLQDQGKSNDYLANILPHDAWDALDAISGEKQSTYPYPSAEESPKIREAFDRFFNTVDTKETPSGVALFSQTEGGPAKSQVTDLHNSLSRAWGDAWTALAKRGEEGKAGGVIAVQTEHEALDRLASVRVDAGLAGSIPEGREQLKSADTKDSDYGGIQGIYDPGTGLSAIVADNTSAAAAPGVLAHEIGVHASPDARLDQRAVELFKIQRKTPFMQAVAKRLDDAGLLDADGNPTHAEETRAYIVEEGMTRGREAGHSALDSGFWEWAQDHLPKPVVNLLKDFAAWARAAMYRVGAIVKAGNMRVDDLIAMAKANVSAIAGGKLDTGGGGFASASGKRDAQWYRSKLADSVESMPSKAKTGNEAAIWLHANGAKLGIKKEEIEWSGVTDWLKMKGKEPVSKDEIRDFLDNNGVKVEDHILGQQDAVDALAKDFRKEGFDIQFGHEDEGMIYLDGDGDPVDYDELPESLQRAVDAASEKFSTPKYSDYQLPGGQNYRELLITLPEAKTPKTFEQWTRENYDGSDDERARDLYAQQIDPNKPHFQSQHFEQPNILAHIRMNDRWSSADGTSYTPPERVLFIEEMQSDWGQTGKKKGFGGRLTHEVDKIVAGATRENRELTPQESAKISEIMRSGEGSHGGAGSVPAAPFVTDTKAWTALALKRVIAYAAEHGYDKIAWTTGDQQASRYDLSAHIDEIRYNKNGDGTFNVGAFKGHEQPWHDDRATTQVIENTLGKEIAAKIVEHASEREQALTGLDLKIGAEGMNAYYDQIVPQVANDVLRKLGGGKVGEVIISTKPTADDVSTEGGESDSAKQPGFAITPELRNAAAAGLPLFSRASRDVPPSWAKTPEEIETARKAGAWAPKATVKEQIAGLRSNLGEKIVQKTMDQFVALKRLGLKPYRLARMASANDSLLEATLHGGLPFINEAGAADIKAYKNGFVGIMREIADDPVRFLSWIAGNRAQGILNRSKQAEADINRLNGEMSSVREQIRQAEKNNDLAAYKDLKKQAAELSSQLEEAKDRAAVTERNFNQADIDTLKGLSQGTLANGKSRPEAYLKGLEEFNKFQKAALDLAESSGIINKESRATWEHEFYLPFYRLAEEEAQVKGPRNNLSGLVNAKGIKRMKGGKEALADPVANTLLNWSHLFNASLRNRAATEALKTATDMGIAREVPAGTKGSVYILENGKPVHYAVDDPYIMTAISALEPAPMTGPLKFLSKFKHILTVGTTASPAFRIAHTLREQLTAVAANPTTYNIAGNWVNGLKLSSKNNPDYYRMIAGGSMMMLAGHGERGEETARMIRDGIGNGEILDTREKIQSALGKTWDWWKKVGERSDEITRANLYQQIFDKTIKDGGTPAEAHALAAYTARDVMDFGLHGTSVALRYLTGSVPFMNARIQGLYKLGRGAVEDPKRFGIVMGATALATIMLTQMQKDDEDIQSLPEYIRDSYWVARIPGADKLLYIPKPFEVGAMATIADRGMEALLNGMEPEDRKRFLSRLLPIIGSQLNMNPIPQAALPGVELWANKDFYRGAPIETEAMQKRMVEDRIGDHTSITAQGAGKAGVLSPVQIDHLINAYFGWLGTSINTAASAAAGHILDFPEQPSWRADDIPVTGRFVREAPNDSSRFLSEFYDQQKQIAQVMGSIKEKIREGNVEDAGQLTEDHAPEIQLEHLFNKTSESIAKVNSQIRTIEESRDMDPEEKRAQIKELIQTKNTYAREAREAAIATGAP
jgi:hypothetical protein